MKKIIMEKVKKIFKSLIPFVSIFLIGAMIGGTIVNVFTSKSRDNFDTQQADAIAYLKFKEIKNSFIPSGVPEIYGKELGISFDEVQDAIDKVVVFGPTYGAEEQKIDLTDFTESELKRYKEIGASIACEFCCGVKTLTNEDGTAACGCAHSIMMRGLTAYLIKNHPQEFDNGEILRELQKWKITYFPKQTLSLELERLVGEGEPGIEQILEEFPDFLPEMVGGC